MNRMSTQARRKAYRYGLWAEFACLCLLSLKGYAILARRARTPAGEIDIVARRGRTVVFVEVKARPNADDAVAAITYTKRERLIAAASAFAATRKFAGLDLRFDLMVVVPWRLPRHMSDAWRA